MEEIRLVNNVEGSVVSDKMLNKFDDLAEAKRRIGQLEGELRVAEQLLDQNIIDSQKDVDNATKTLDLVVKTNHPKSASIQRFTYSGSGGSWLELIGEQPELIERITLSNDDITKFADAAVLADSKLKVKEAKEAKEHAEKLQKAERESAEKLVESMKKTLQEERESIKKSIEAGVENAAKQDRKKISDLELRIKGLLKEHDLLLEERENLAKERDLSLEAMEAQIRLYKNRLAILERPTKTILDSIKTRLNSWWFKRNIVNLEV